MKKKIINGILIVAALFATSTSFVSCKDNLADEVHDGFAQVEQQMNDLQSKIDDVNGKIATLESSVLKNSEEIANLKTQLASLQSELSTLQSQVNQNTADIAANKAAIEALTARVAALEENVNGLLALVNNLVVGATVRATVDPVVGSINLPGYNPLFLAAYAGENDTEIAEFPVASEDYNVDPNGHSLEESEIGVEPLWLNPGAEGWNGEWNNGLIMGLNPNNAGTLYFTLNPIGLDATQLSFDLVNSLGTVSPVTFSNVRQSSHILTPSTGKHGNEGPEDAEADNPYLYAADAQIPLSANADLAWNKEVSSTVMMEQLNHQLSTMIARVKAAGDRGLENTVSGLVGDAYTLIQEFYQSWYKNLSAKQYQNLRVTYNDGNGNERIITSPENIVTAVVSPLSYKMFYMLGEVVGAPQIDTSLLTGGLSQGILKEVPDAAEAIIGTVTATKATVTVKDEKGKVIGIFTTTNSGKTWVNEMDNDKEVDFSLGKYTGEDIFEAISDDKAAAQKTLDNAMKKYEAVRTNSVLVFANSAANYINKMSNALITELGPNAYFNAVAPIILIDTKDGIDRLVSDEQCPRQRIVSTEGQMTLYLTSATEEYLVPAFKKYIAVLQGGKIVSANLIDGSEKVISVELPMGESEIIYSTIDFRGYTVTKKYPVNRVEE